MQKLIFWIKRTLCLSVLVLLILLVYGSVTVPDSMVRLTDEAEPRSIYTVTQMTVREEASQKKTRVYDARVSLFRAIPVKLTRLTVSERIQAVPGGTLFGLRLYTSGVIVVSTEQVQTENGMISPSKAAGLRKGDVLLTVDGIPIRDHTQFSALLADAQGQALSLTFLRGGRRMETTFRAAYSVVYHRYMAGLWVRDSAAGIGTMTFYLPHSGVYAGLGHAVCDVDTGEILPLYQGDIVSAAVNGCKKGLPGQAGELRGSISAQRVGSLLYNEADGVYGRLDACDSGAQALPVALPGEVRTGEAEIVSTADENGPQRYRVVIEKVTEKEDAGRNLVLRVTDERLLSATGGIVQGMSGSPVLQNGAIVGAVTHVFVNDPHRGYAIFAHTMLLRCLELEQQETALAS